MTRLPTLIPYPNTGSKRNFIALARKACLNPSFHLHYKRVVTLITLILCLGFSGGLFAEPQNFYDYQQTLTHYYASGTYMHEIDSIVHRAKASLEKALKQKKSKPIAIVLDIDETALSNIHSIFEAYNLVYQSGDRIPPHLMTTLLNPFHDPAIKPTLDLYQYAIKNHVAVFFISGRNEEDRDGTIQNLKDAGYTQWEALILRQKGEPIEKFIARKHIVEQGYDIAINIGDQISDLRGGYADHRFKLPNPFYYVP